MSNHVTFTIPCKPYVNHFLVHNYGDPVNLYQQDNPYLPLLKLLLKKPPKDKNSTRPINSPVYQVQTRIILSMDDFLVIGYDMSRMAIIIFNKEVERNVKHIMHVIVGINYSFCSKLSEAIDKFTSDFDIPEDVWPHESIRKEFMRNSTLAHFDLKQTVMEKLTKLFLAQLSEFGTIDNSILEEYEINAKTTKQPGRNSKSMGTTIATNQYSKPAFGS